VIEQAQDIVALLSESGVRTRRERGAFVAKLRDQMGLTWSEIGQQLHVTKQRAKQLYDLNQILQRTAHSPFGELSPYSRNFLNVIACQAGFPKDWEQNPALIGEVIRALTRMRRGEALRFRSVGARTVGELEDFMRQRGIAFTQDVTEAQDDDDDLSVKDVTGPLDPDQAAQAIAEFFNQKGFRGQFKIWPKGTYVPPEQYRSNPWIDWGGYDFTMSISDFMADAWEERWQAVREFENVLHQTGYTYDQIGEPGEPRSFNFYREDAE
jgi:hypothetical protein